MGKQRLTGFLFPRSSRLKSKKTISRLFNREGRRIYRFPISFVYLPVSDQETPIQLLVSVPKRRFSRAVDRNKIKRQLREAFRHSWPQAQEQIENKQAYAVMLMYSHHEMVSSEVLHSAVKSAIDEFVEAVV